MNGPEIGAEASLHFMQWWLENEPEGAQLKRNGATPSQRMSRLRDRREAVVRSRQKERYDDLCSSARDRCAQEDLAIAKIRSELQTWLKAMRNGSMHPQQVQANVAAAVQALNGSHQVLDLIEKDAEAAAAMIDLDPANYEAQTLDRFPRLAGSLPIITEAFLLGEDDTDPLGDAR